MGHLQLHVAIRHHYQKCGELGKALASGPAEEPVHSFRLEVKKLRALLRLAASVSHSSVKAKLPRELKTFYAMTGVIRNLQLQRKALENVAVQAHLGLPASCIALLDDRINTAADMMLLFLKNPRPFGKKSKQWSAPSPAAATDEAGKKFLQQKAKTFLSPAAADLQDEQRIHAIRKELKDILYVWPYLSEKIFRQAQSNGLPSQEELSSRGRLLGDFHDICIILTLLKDRSFLLSACPQSAKFLEVASGIWLHDKQILLEKIEQVFANPPEPANLLEPANLPGPVNLPEPVTSSAPINQNFASYELHVD
ncbi:CHAD domain-containing protein [Flavitalea sp. BT771]|uniref:CHAD domain-containing protein n=1 Tax=Flavitalea sp. BT771 TaxID=3063329 RepID=UPI0026E2C14B|nr:CHAD domain-containing protein [Flavitalea sp. BT771]MDO6429512.1 CHAD domain-containing protein [Flavitalea sp. BT771]MDV6218360.1 CHAD domain-containing protein [Flavitalea sp. BT771]